MNIDLLQVTALMQLLQQYQCDSVTADPNGTITITKSLHVTPKRELSDKEKQDQLYGKTDKTEAAEAFAARADAWASTKRLK